MNGSQAAAGIQPQNSPQLDLQPPPCLFLLAAHHELRFDRDSEIFRLVWTVTIGVITFNLGIPLTSSEISYND